MRRFTRGEPPLPSIRNVVVFLACAVAAPGIVSFADAAIVTASGWANDYWPVWHTRFRSNVLTNLIWVPVVVIARGAGSPGCAPRRRAGTWRRQRSRCRSRWSRSACWRRELDGDDAPALRPAAAVPVGRGALRSRRRQRSAVDVLRAGNLERGRRARAVLRRDAEQNTLSLQIFLTMTAASSLLLASMFAEQRRAKLVLADSESRYRGVFESTSDGILVTDASHAVAAVNPAFCRLTGYSAEQVRTAHPRTSSTSTICSRSTRIWTRSAPAIRSPRS